MKKSEKKKIWINGKPFEYEEYSLSYENSSPITIEEATNLLKTVKRLFDSRNLNFYLVYGTLLGAVREKSLIAGDEDVDVFVTDEDKLYNMIPYLDENGLHLIRAAKGNTYSFRLGNHGYIDVYILRPLHFAIWKPYCYSLCMMVTPKKYFKTFEKIIFLGVECQCPANPEALLEFWYGKTWRTPIRGHKFCYEVKSAYFWHSKILPVIKGVLFYEKWNKQAKSLLHK